MLHRKTVQVFLMLYAATLILLAAFKVVSSDCSDVFDKSLILMSAVGFFFDRVV